MNSSIRNIEPKVLWNYFADINAIPRPSKKEALIVEFIVSFGKKLGLETIVDKVKNVIIKKPATKGMEGAKTVVLQSHLDMVHQKNKDTIFDFDKEGIQMEIKEDWIYAKGTTLGADNGIGVAAIMSILSSKDIPHPPIEALFTVDEETGMTGAMRLNPKVLSGEILLNLDSENDNEICIGCAGGINITALQEYREIKPPKDAISYKLTVKGLQGGHSGIDIHRGLGNSIKIINRVLSTGFGNSEIYLSKVSGGSLRNAIPRESTAIIVIKKSFEGNFKQKMKSVVEDILIDFEGVEPNLEILYTPFKLPSKIMEPEIQKKIIRSISDLHDGVYTMHPDIKGLVETSNNLASVVAKDKKIEIACLTRSFSESKKMKLVNTLKRIFELADFEVIFSENYPGWKPDTSSKILKIMCSIYTEIFKKNPNVAACHAGLECGILGKIYPNIEMVSFGPTIRGAHSPEERVSILSTRKFWIFLQEILKNIPDNNA